MTDDLLAHLESIGDLAFWAFVRRAGECWVWNGYINRGGYGRVCRTEGNRNVSYTAHRYSWKLAHGSVSADMDVCHKCDNRRCVRPDHLFVGTRLDNMADMRSKGRSSRGERNRSAKLTEVDVAAIRERARQGVPQRKLAADFRLTQSTVSHIITRRLWKHIP